MLAIFHFSVPESVYLRYTICYYTIINESLSASGKEKNQLWKSLSLLTQVQCVWQIVADATTTNYYW